MINTSHHPRGRLPNDNPNPIDIHVGNRIKLRRKNLGLSQNILAQKMGVTFQQIQKYEKGLNRIGASRLFDFSKVLNVSMDFFFADMPEDIKNMSPASISGTKFFENKESLNDPLKSTETLELVCDYYKLKAHFPKAAKNLKDMIHQLSFSFTVQQKL